MLSLTSCKATEYLNGKHESTKEKYIEQSRKNVSEYLKDKYPDETFEIDDVFIRKSSNHGILESVIPSGYSEHVSVKIIDKNGTRFEVKTDASKTGNSGELSCSDNVQKDLIIKAVTNALNSMTKLNQEKVMECRVSFSDYYFHEKFEGNVNSFLNYIKDEKEKKEVYGSFIYYDSLIDFAHFTNEENRTLYLMDKVLFVAMKEKKEIPTNILASIRGDSAIRALYPYALNIYDVHEYKFGIAKVYKNYISENDDMKYTYPFAFYDKVDAYSEEVYGIHSWSKAIKSHFGYEDIKIDNYEVMTRLYIAKEGYIHFIPCEKLNIDPNDNSYTYFLLVNSNGNYRAYIAKELKHGKTMFIDGHLYVGDLEENDEWCIVRVSNEYKRK